MSVTPMVGKRRQGYPYPDAEIYPQKGYEITARTKMPATDEEREFVFFVPYSEAGTIKANIGKFQKKKEEDETEEIKF